MPARAALCPPTALGGGVTARLIKGGVTFLFGMAPMLGKDEAAKEFVTVRSIKDGFEIDLPEWLNPYHEARAGADD